MFSGVYSRRYGKYYRRIAWFYTVLFRSYSIRLYRIAFSLSSSIGFLPNSILFPKCLLGYTPCNDLALGGIDLEITIG